MTARVCRHSVAKSEINTNQLKARMWAFSRLSSKRRMMTARVCRHSVAKSEINTNQLKARK